MRFPWPDRLVRAALLGGLRQRSWTALVVAAFLVLAAAAAAAPMFAEASGNAAFQARRDAVPVTARQDDAAVVRLSVNAGPRSEDQQPLLDDLRAIRGLTEPRLTGGSVGAELVTGVFWESTVSAGDRRDRGRLFAVDDPARDLVPVGGDGGAPDGLWFPAPLAERLAVRAGDAVVLTVGRGIAGERKRAPVRVAGVYTVDADGRLPADLPGSRTWTLRRGDVPGDTEYRTLPAYLLIGDVETVERLARAVGDELLWSAEAALLPGTTLAGAQRTAGDVEELRRRYASTHAETSDDPLALRFASGIGRITAVAQETTDRIRQRTRPVEWAATTVGLASVLAVAVLSLRRRGREIRHAVAVGLSPARVGGLWLLEHLLPALLGSALGWVVGWQLVTRFGPPGEISASLRPATAAVALAGLGGLVVVAGAGALRAARLVRPAPPATTRRAVPWEALVVVAALTAAAGLAGAGGTGGNRGVDLLVPLLTLAGIGVLAGWLPGRLARRRATAPPGSPARAVGWLARRRLGAGGAERRLVVTVVTTGLGMLLFALAALHSTAVSADDRVAVAAGAEAVATLDGSWELDGAAAPAPEPDDEGRMPEGPVPGVRTPPLPRHHAGVAGGHHHAARPDPA